MMTFFQPEDTFLDWLKAYANDRIVYDVGCGNGEFLQRMWGKKIHAIGLDLYADENIKDETVRRLTMCTDARESLTLKRSKDLLLFCRPSHTGWVAETLDNLGPDSEVLYISKPGNQYVDLVDFTVSLLPAPGLVEEQVLQVQRPFPRHRGPPDLVRAGVARFTAQVEAAGEDLEDFW
jgi:hypothetical protein